MAPRNRRLAVGLGAVVLVGTAWFLYAWRGQPGFITGMHPAGGERAVFTMRHNPDNGKARAWIGVIEAGEVAWSRELPDLTYSIHARHGLTVDEDLVTVKVSDTESYARVLAFEMSTGEPRWSSDELAFAPSEYDSMLHVVMGARPFGGGGQVLHPEHDRAEARLVMRAASDGTVLWEHPLATDHMYGTALTDQHFAYRTDSGWIVLRRADGSVALAADAYGTACLEHERFAIWSRDTLQTADLAAEKPELTTRPLPAPGITQSCGTHEGRWVFTVGGDTDGDSRNFALVAIDPDRAAIDWTIELGPWEPSGIARARDNDGPDAHPLQGPMSDFVPVLLTAHETDAVKLAVLDLNAHAIAWESRARPELLHYQVLRGDADHHFLDGNADLVAIDGTTGEVTAAVRFAHEAVRAFHATDGRLWAYSMEYAKMTELPWFLLDARTLEPVARGNDELRPEPNTDAFKAWLR